MMNIEEAIYNRKSIRKYKKDKVEMPIIKELVNAALYAPSANNVQGWKFIYIDDDNILRQINKMGGAFLFRVVHQAFIVVSDSRLESVAENERDLYLKGVLYKGDIQSGAAGIQNMLLRAHSFGVSTCWINMLPEPSKLKEFLEIPDGYTIIGAVTIGYSDSEPRRIERKYKPEDIIFYNKFGKEFNNDNT